MTAGAFIPTAIMHIVDGIQNSKNGQKAVDNQSVALWEWIKPIFQRDDKGFAVELEQNPKDEYLQIELRGRLRRKTKSNAPFATELNNLLNDLKPEVAKNDCPNSKMDFNFDVRIFKPKYIMEDKILGGLL